MDKTSMTLGCLVGRQIAGQRRKKRLPKGSLRCTTLPKFPKCKHNSTWEPIATWSGLDSFYGGHMWTDGEYIYNSYVGYSQHVLNGDTWEPKTWSGILPSGDCIWTDGTNIYYSSSAKQYVLNGDTWEPKTWNVNLNGREIWTDGTNIYHGSDYVLNGDTWEPKTWNGLSVFGCYGIWSDGKNIYYSSNNKQYVLNGDTWEPKTWNGISANDILIGTACKIWTDGENIYHTGSKSLVLNGDTWEPKAWGSYFTPYVGPDIWTDGTNIYYSNEEKQYILK